LYHQPAGPAADVSRVTALPSRRDLPSRGYTSRPRAFDKSITEQLLRVTAMAIPFRRAQLPLRPVTFGAVEADQAGSHSVQYGLIAEVVADVLAEVAVDNGVGRSETAAYQTRSRMLFNELRKEHSRITRLQRRIDEMTSHLRGKANE
jgi:hypothetical protein